MSAAPQSQNGEATEAASAAQGQPLATSALRTLAHYNLLRPYIYHSVLEETLNKAPLDEKITKALLTQFRQTNGLRDVAGEEKFLRTMGWSQQDYLWQIELPHRIAAHSAEHFLAKAEARFLDRKNQLDQVVYSLIRVKDGSLARELYLRIEEGEATFAELAQTYSEGPEKQSGGIVGPAPLSQAHPQLVQRLKSASAGELLAPFAVETFWLVVRVERHQPASLDEPMRQRMAQELFDEWIQEEVTLRIQQLCPAPQQQPA
ncbi:MAG: peptidylprolyl isomerase [Synechococcaceae cyanobacterium]